MLAHSCGGDVRAYVEDGWSSCLCSDVALVIWRVMHVVQGFIMEPIIAQAVSKSAGTSHWTTTQIDVFNSELRLVLILANGGPLPFVACMLSAACRKTPKHFVGLLWITGAHNVSEIPI